MTMLKCPYQILNREALALHLPTEASRLMNIRGAAQMEVQVQTNLNIVGCPFLEVTPTLLAFKEKPQGKPATQLQAFLRVHSR